MTTSEIQALYAKAVCRSLRVTEILNCCGPDGIVHAMGAYHVWDASLLLGKLARWFRFRPTRYLCGHGRLACDSDIFYGEVYSATGSSVRWRSRRFPRLTLVDDPVSCMTCLAFSPFWKAED